jgi:hypothetical protein
MTIRCEQFDDLLMEGDSFSMQAAEAHAAGCDACRETLLEWKEISDTARSMKESWQSDTLLPRIQRSLRRDRSPLMRIAAAVAITLSIGGTAWYAMRDTNRDMTYDQKILNVAAVDDVERAEQAYVDAITRLESVADRELASAQTPVMVNYREKLMLIDDAIAEVQANIEANRQNAYLRRQLLSMYSEKQRTLQAVVREGDHGSNH